MTIRNHEYLIDFERMEQQRKDDFGGGRDVRPEMIKKNKGFWRTIKKTFRFGGGVRVNVTVCHHRELILYMCFVYSYLQSSNPDYHWQFRTENGWQDYDQKSV